MEIWSGISAKKIFLRFLKTLGNILKRQLKGVSIVFKHEILTLKFTLVGVG